MDEDRAFRTITRRLVPFLMLCYGVAYLDRVNVGFAKLEMLSDLKFSETVYGFGAGIFFLGYFLFEVPSNLLLHRIGARVWIGRIMITWGLVSGAFVFIHTAAMFYTLRFLLGVAEAGFYPGIILYLTYWYPSARRGRIVALFMAAIPISGLLGGPLSGWILDTFTGRGGWTGWQWLFVIEAVPSIVMGIVTIVYLDNGVEQASWLTDDEKRLVLARLAADRAEAPIHEAIGSALADRRLWLMCFIYFCCVMGQYGLTFWLPTLIEAAGVHDVFRIGLLTAVPYGAAAIAMVLFGRSADRHRERRWHTVVPLLLGAAGLVVSTMAGTHTTFAMVGLTIAAIGILTCAPLFWGLPTALLGGVAAAATIAAINSIGNLAGFASPYLVGWLNDLTHNTAAGMYAIALSLVIGAVAVLCLPARAVNR
jgi:D-galactonate transporter